MSRAGGDEPSSAFRLVVEETRETLHERVRRFRWLIILLSLIVALSLVGTVAFGSWRPLAGLLFCIPLAAGFLWFDTRRVEQWQEWILNLWLHGRLDVALFRQEIVKFRAIPERSLRGMLETLPDLAPDVPWGMLPGRIRWATAETAVTLLGLQRDRTAAAAAASLIAAAAVAAGVAALSPGPLALAAAAAPLPLLVARVRGWRLRRLERAVSQQEWTVKDRPTLRKGLESLDWGAVSAAARGEWIDRLLGPAVRESRDARG